MKNICLLFILLIISACKSDHSNKYELKNSRVATQQKNTTKQDNFRADFASNAQVTVEIERKTIKTANIRFQVKDLIESTQRIEAIVDQYDGFVSGMSQNNSNYSINNEMTLRVPAESLDKFLNEIEKEAIHTHYKRIHVQDVTEEFVDKTSRLNTKKEVRDRYIAILRDKAKTVKDVLDAEEKIRVIQEEIEAIEGRLKYLNNQTTLSTVTIDMYEQIEYTKSPDTYEKSFFAKIADGFVNGWKLIQVIAVGLVNIWPIVLIALAVFLGRKRILGTLRRKSDDE